MKEEILKEFLKKLDEQVCVRSTISATGRVEILPAIVNDMEAIIEINGQWDREDLKDILYDLYDKDRFDMGTTGT